ncbi:MAG TPA: NUDIX domain-containing protein [Cyclobacteriaceae bacterium]|nr:NUDIX domain-containing protein [Cyclobacteriaceae bacterium]
MELIDLINQDDEVIGQATKDECHENGLLHRSVFIFLFDKQERMILQKRSSKKKIRPNKITAAACGHVKAGESTKSAALRELKEELGISTKLYSSIKTIGPYDYDKELISLFIGKTNLQPKKNSDEIDDLLYLTINEIKSCIENNTIDFGASFKKVFIEYLDGDYWLHSTVQIPQAFSGTEEC